MFSFRRSKGQEGKENEMYISLLRKAVCFGIFGVVYFSVVAKNFVQNKTNQKQNMKNFQGRLSMKARQCYLEIKHNPVLTGNGGFGVLQCGKRPML